VSGAEGEVGGDEGASGGFGAYKKWGEYADKSEKNAFTYHGISMTVDGGK
jgi:hypothetical protein